MFRHTFPSVLALAATACLCAIPSHAANPSAVATQVQKEVSSAGAPLPPGGMAAAGAPVVTGANSRAELKLANGTTVRIGQGSSFSFDGGNLALRQGSALFKLPGGKARITTPSLGCTAGSGVISTHAAKNYEACFVIEGAATVNGVALKTGEGYVRENGSARKLAFDVKRMLDTSFLVTKFPKTPWVVEAFAAAAIQSELLAANRAQSALLSGRAPVNGAAAAVGKNRTASALVASAGGGSQNNGSAASAVASNVGSGVSGGTLSLNSGSSSSAAVFKIGAGSQTLSGASFNGAVISVNGATNVTTNSTLPPLTIPSGAVLTTGGSISTGAGINAGTGTQPINGVVLVGNPGTLVNGSTVQVNNGGLTVIGAGNGALTVIGAGTGVLNVNGGTITTTNGVVLYGNGTANPITTLRSVPSKR